MLAKELIVAGMCLMINASSENPSPLKESYEKLTSCQIKTCKATYKLEGMTSESNKKMFSACQSGCNILVIDGADQCLSSNKHFLVQNSNVILNYLK